MRFYDCSEVVPSTHPVLHEMLRVEFPDHAEVVTEHLRDREGKGLCMSIPPMLTMRDALFERVPMEQAYLQSSFRWYAREAMSAAAGAFASLVAVKTCVPFFRSLKSLLGTLSESSTDPR